MLSITSAKGWVSISLKLRINMAELNKDLLFIGPPGSGKSTMAERFADRNRWSLINTGSLLRTIALHSEHSLHEPVSWHLKNGILIGSELLQKVLSCELASYLPRDNIVFDGAVRNMDQFEVFDQVMKDASRSYLPTLVLTSIDACIERLMIRGRGDDYDEMILRRVEDFNKKTLPVIAKLGSVEHIKVVNEDEDDAARSIQEIEAHLGLGKGCSRKRYLTEIYEGIHFAREYYGTAWRREAREELFTQLVQSSRGEFVRLRLSRWLFIRKIRGR